MSLSRRDVLKLSVAGGAAMALPAQRALAGATLLNRLAESALPAPYTMPFTVPPVVHPVRSSISTDYYRVTMEPFVAEVVPGLQTPLWGYNGMVPGPTFRMTRGRPAVVRMVNNLPAVHPELDYVPWTSVHLHGSASLPQYDGYASDISNPGQYKDYRYPNSQVARTLWYHDHGLGHTAQNVYQGLAGQYHVVDPLEQSLPIPHGQYDVPLTVSDMMFQSNGSLLFDSNGEDGFYGDVIAVNGRPWPVMKVARRKYRFRILNASVSRAYRWYLDDGSPMSVIATDGGLMPVPRHVSSFRHGVAERYEVIIDFSRYAPGARVKLRNQSPKNNRRFTNTHEVMAFDVTDEPFDPTDNEIPAALNPANPVMNLNPAESVARRTMELERKDGLWTVNGRVWDDVVASGFTRVLADPLRDEVEIWELTNPHGGWHHPAHIHFIDFRVLSRNGRPPMPHELGAKDVVFLGENETVRLLIRFDSGEGRYMMHCHNLVHEDHDMMAQFEIRNPAVPAHDPLSVRARPLPEIEL